MFSESCEEVFRHLSQTGPSRRSAAPNPIPHTPLSERRIRVLRSPPCRLSSTKKNRRQDLSPPEVLGGLLPRRKSGEGSSPIKSWASTLFSCSEARPRLSAR